MREVEIFNVGNCCDARTCHPGGHYCEYYPDALTSSLNHRNSFEDQEAISI